MRRFVGLSIVLAVTMVLVGLPTGVAMAQPVPPDSAWFSAPPGTAAARPTCPDPNQWTLLYWGGQNQTGIATAAGTCPNADRFWSNQSGRWLGFSPANPQASDSWTLETGLAAFIHGALSQAGARPCPTDPAVCTFAAELNRAVLSGDVNAIAARARFREVECPGGTAQGLGGPFPLCDGARPGERRPGIQIAYLSSEGTVVSEEGLKNAVRGWTNSADPAANDEFGTGASRLYSLGCPFTQTVPGPGCAEQFSVVFSQRPRGIPWRGQLIFFAQRPAGGGPAQITNVAIGPVLPEDQLAVVLRGGNSSAIFSPQGYAPFGTYYPWSPDAMR